MNLGSIALLNHSAMTSINAFPTPRSSQMNPMQLNAESRILGIDNRASRCISTHRGDFIGELQPSMLTIHGYAGRTTNSLHIGTIRWKWMDDIGTHEFLIPNSIHDPSGHNLLSPQHWAKHTGEGKDTVGSGCTTTQQEVTLFWGNGKYRKTIPLTRGSNMADLHTALLCDGFTSCILAC